MFYNFTLHHNHDNVSTIVAFEIQMLPSLIPDINSNYGDLINVIGVDCGHWTGTVDSLSIYKNSLIVAALLCSGPNYFFSVQPSLVRSKTQLDLSSSSVARLGSLPDWVDTITKASMLPTHSPKVSFRKNPAQLEKFRCENPRKKSNQSMQAKLR